MAGDSYSAQIDSKASSSAESRAYGANTSGNIYGYTAPTTLASLVSDPMSLAVAVGGLFLLAKLIKRKG